MAARFTIKDLAKATNCSIATASSALNGRGRMSAAKRREIIKVAQQWGYQPNVAGRNLRRQRTDIIGLMFHPSPSVIFRNIFYVEVMEGLEEGLAENGFNLLLGSGREELAQGRIPKFMLQGAVDALILLGPFPETTLELLLSFSTPSFQLDSSHDQLAIESLTSDGYGGSLQAVDHLVALGHRRIAMLAYGNPEYNIASRTKGFEAAVRRRGLDAGECPVINQFTLNAELPTLLHSVLNGPKAPTAFLCVNDTLALFVVDYLQSQKLTVPGRISVIGFDDDIPAQQNQLTTVRIDKARLGRAGAEMLIERLKNTELPVRKATLPVELIVRASTAQAPN